MILVTGATGRLGGHVVRALRRLGQPVRSLVRRGSHYYWLNDTGSAYFFGDLRDARSLHRACAGVRRIVACSGIEYETRENDHQSVTVDGHLALWNAARARGVEKIVYVSAMGVDRGLPIPWFDAKAQAERSLAASGIRWTTLRPAPYTRTFAEIARTAGRRGNTVVWGHGTNLVAPVAARDVALIAIAALDLPDLDGRAVDVVGPEVMTSAAAVARAIAVGAHGRAWNVPEPVARAVARALRPIGRRWEHRVLQRSRWFVDPFIGDPAPLAALTGVSPTPYDAAVAQDLALIAALEDPRGRDERVVHQRFDPIIYEPGVADLASLPIGPLRYEE